MRSFSIGALIVVLVTFSMSCGSIAEQPVFSSTAYKVFADRVEQDGYVAKAVSAKELVSDYRSPANPYKKSVIDFKFAINGQDNEMVSGRDHHFNVLGSGDLVQTPLIQFGEQLELVENEPSAYIKPNTKLLIRLDMRPVLKAFAKQGYFNLFNGEKLLEKDFKSVYIAGSTSPMTWDFNQLTQHPELELKDTDKDGIYEVILDINKEVSDLEKEEQRWKLSADISGYPRMESDNILSDAIYTMALEEMQQAIEPDSTFRTGNEWAGVWTRDISYSILLSMAHMQPEVARNSLLKKVNGRIRIIQDTGTGGAWPVSSDRMIWAVAAWELYLINGDRNWLEFAFTVISNSLQDDYVTLYDSLSGLVKGESSFLDWREQTYPAWMQPADIFESKCLSTNAVHFEANKVAARMARLLELPTDAEMFSNRAEVIKAAVNKHLWLTDKKYYSQYLYGRGDQLRSGRSEALGEALAVIFELADADRQKEIVANTPVTNFGIPCVYPDLAGVPPYHNNAVWPFVQSFWLMAGAKVGNEQTVLESLAALYRPAALFLTNKENFVAVNGDYKGTQINSSNMLWSLSGMLGIMHKVIFGIQFTIEGIRFDPFVPVSFGGNRKLSGFRYHNAILDIEVSGTGNRIKSFSVDGHEKPNAILSRELMGSHSIKIVMEGDLAEQQIKKMDNYTTLPEPKLGVDKNRLYWLPLTSVKQYKLIWNGELVKVISGSSTNETIFKEGRYQLIAVDENGIESFASEPVDFFQESYLVPFNEQSNQIEWNKGKELNAVMDIPNAGIYDIDIEYANGSGPVNTDNKCAIRTFGLNNQMNGVFVFPQRGKDSWDQFGFSNSIRVYLLQGKHKFCLKYLPFNQNMDGFLNVARFKHLRIRRIYTPNG